MHSTLTPAIFVVASLRVKVSERKVKCLSLHTALTELLFRFLPTMGSSLTSAAWRERACWKVHPWPPKPLGWFFGCSVEYIIFVRCPYCMHCVCIHLTNSSNTSCSRRSSSSWSVMSLMEGSMNSWTMRFWKSSSEVCLHKTFRNQCMKGVQDY